MLKRRDYFILSIICFFLGIFFISQFYSGKEFNRLTQPENNQVIALEVAKLTKNNADLRREVADLTNDLIVYKNTTESQKEAFDQYREELGRLLAINGKDDSSGQGVIIKVKGKLSTPQVVDLVNALKNIGADTIAIGDTRLLLNTSLNQFSGLDDLEIKVIGNSKLLKSAVERKGGIAEQIVAKDASLNVAESDSISIPAGTSRELHFSKVVKDN